MSQKASAVIQVREDDKDLNGGWAWGWEGGAVSRRPADGHKTEGHTMTSPGF